MSETDEELLRRVMDATASLWNELTYERRQQFFDGDSVWDTEDYRKRYIGVLGSASAQQAIRKNDQAWRGFFDSDEPDKGLPGYWGNEDEGRDLRWYGRNDQYTILTLDPEHHWRTNPPLWTSARTTSSPVRPRPASNSCTPDATSSSGSAKPRERSRGYSRNFQTGGTAAIEYGGCIESEPLDATTR